MTPRPRAKKMERSTKEVAVTAPSCSDFEPEAPDPGEPFDAENPQDVSWSKVLYELPRVPTRSVVDWPTRRD